MKFSSCGAVLVFHNFIISTLDKQLPFKCGFEFHLSLVLPPGSSIHCFVCDTFPMMKHSHVNISAKKTAFAMSASVHLLRQVHPPLSVSVISTSSLLVKLLVVLHLFISFKEAIQWIRDYVKTFVVCPSHCSPLPSYCNAETKT